MDSVELLNDAFGRIRGMVESSVNGLSRERLAFAPGRLANPIGWLVWHLTRVQDDHIAGVAGSEQIWTSGGWAERFDLPLSISDTGYGHSHDQVISISVEASELSAYYREVEKFTLSYLNRLSESDLDRIVDRRWDPPVTLGARLVSVIGDGTAHGAQAQYVRGVLESLADQ
ncbi:MAG: mycothiol transferase [Acidimicrobiales bacterium]